MRAARITVQQTAVLDAEAKCSEPSTTMETALPAVLLYMESVLKTRTAAASNSLRSLGKQAIRDQRTKTYKAHNVKDLTGHSVVRNVNLRNPPLNLLPPLLQLPPLLNLLPPLLQPPPLLSLSLLNLVIAHHHLPKITSVTRVKCWGTRNETIIVNYNQIPSRC